MDSYQKLISMVENAINKIKQNIVREEDKLTKKQQEANSLNSQKTIIDTNLTARKYYYEVITNFKKVTQEKRWWFILTLIGRSIVIALLAWLGSAILLDQAIVTLIFTLLEMVVIGFTSMEFITDIAEERRIKKENKREDLLSYIEELENNLFAINKKITKINDEMNILKTNISNFKSELYLFEAKLEGVKTRRNEVIAKLLNANETEINTSFAIDQDLIKLERSLNNG